MIDGYRALGTELLEQLDGRIDAICLYVGTAGCYLGITRARSRATPGGPTGSPSSRPSRPSCRAGRPGTHRIEGGGVGFLPPMLTHRRRSTRSSPVSTADAFAMARRAARADGVWSGPSTGANIARGARAGAAARRGRPGRDHPGRLRAEVPRRRALHLSDELGPLDWFAAASAPCGPARRDVHRVLGRLLPLRGRVAVDRHRLPGGLRAAAAGPRRVRRVAATRSAAAAVAVRSPRSPASSSPVTSCSGTTPSRPSERGWRRCSGNLQVIIVGLRRLARCWASGRPGRPWSPCRSCWSGSSSSRASSAAARTAPNPQLGVVLGIATAICYSAYLLLIRLRRPRPAPAGRAGRRSRPVRRRAVLVRHRRGRRRPRPDARAGQPLLAGHARDHRAVGRLPAHLDLAAAAAGDRHLGHPAEPAGDDGGPRDGAARRDAVARRSCSVSSLVIGGITRGDDPTGATARRRSGERPPAA